METPSLPATASDALPRLLIVNGLSASGKSTLGKALAEAFGFPFFSKDAFKEIMFDHIGWSDSSWADKLGASSTEILWNIVSSELRAGRSLVIESNFTQPYADQQIHTQSAQTPFRAIELHCIADREVSVERYIDRAQSGERHPGHGETNPNDLYAEKIPRLRDANDAMLTATDGYLIVDTTDTDAVDTPTVIEQVRRLLWPVCQQAGGAG